MTDKEKQIEEIYDIIADCCNNKSEDECIETMNCDECKAISLYNAGYRNCKDKVVLTREKFIQANKCYSYYTLKSYRKDDLIEHIRVLEHNWANAEERIDNQAKHLGKLTKQLEQARKETAREILKNISSVVHDNRQYGNDFVVIYYSEIQDLAKQYGVEVE